MAGQRIHLDPVNGGGLESAAMVCHSPLLRSMNPRIRRERRRRAKGLGFNGGGGFTAKSSPYRLAAAPAEKGTALWPSFLGAI